MTATPIRPAGGARTVYLGTSVFAATVLERLAGSPFRPELVITRPDRPKGRGRSLTAPPVAEAARRLGLPVDQPEDVGDPGTSARIAALRPDALVLCAYGAILREPLLSAHPVYNAHPSLLPRWRGAAPIERAIMAGDPETGVSIMRLVEALDAGPVCLAHPEPIRPDDTYGTLAARLAGLAGTLLVEALITRPPFVDQAADGVTYAEKLDGADRTLDPQRPAAELERTVRALHPHVGARVALVDGSMLGVSAARLAADPPGLAPGPAAVDGRLLVGCRPGVLELTEVQPPGGRSMSADAYLRGRGLPSA